MKKGFGRILFLAVIAAFFLIVASCSNKSRASSFVSSLNEIDSRIAAGDTLPAVKLLGKIERATGSPLEAISVYKRYSLLSEKKAGQKFLAKSVRKYPRNLELRALYAWAFFDSGDFGKALEHAEVLKDTKYSSVYAEMYFRSLMNEKNNADNLAGGSKRKPKDAPPLSKESGFAIEETVSGSLFISSPLGVYSANEFAPLYGGAYKTSGDNLWRRNEAVIYLLRGDFSSAAALAPETLENALDAYFWGAVLYDSEKYTEAAACLVQAQALLENERNSGVSGVEIASLLDDAYIHLGEDEASEAVRSNLIARLVLGNEDAPPDALAAMYLNSALHSLKRDDEKAAHRQLSFVVEQWPDFVPGLIAYGNFAYNSARHVMDDPLTLALREAGVASADMKRFDELPRIPVSDALGRMEEALARTNDPLLYVAKLELEDRVASSAEKDARVRRAKVWRLLEHNAIDIDLYPQEIMQYSLCTLIQLENIDEAESVFIRYLNARISPTSPLKLDEGLFLVASEMKEWELEYAAFFAAIRNDGALSKRLYEMALYGIDETGNAPRSDDNEILVEATIQSAVNLAMIYSSTGEKEKALSLYGKIAGRTADGLLKAEIMYRLANIYNSQGDKENALRSLEYGIYLDPGNVRARILLNSLKPILR